MDESIDSLGEAKIIWTLDCNAGYWQVLIAHGDREKTAFICHKGAYHYKRMPFVLTNAPATIQRALDIILSGVKWQSCLVYLDDVIVYSKTQEVHFQHSDCSGSRHHHFGSSSSRSDLFISSVRRRNCPGNRPTAQPSPNGRRGSRQSPGGNRSPKQALLWVLNLGLSGVFRNSSSLRYLPIIPTCDGYRWHIYCNPQVKILKSLNIG